MKNHLQRLITSKNIKDKLDKYLSIRSRSGVKSRFPSLKPRIDKIEGWLMKGQGRWLYETALSLPDGARVLEIGCYKGKSTVCLGYGCLNTRKHIFSIDTFGGVYEDVQGREGLEDKFKYSFLDEWKRNLSENGLSDYATPLISDSRQAGHLWSAPIHLLFIDGSHKFDDVMHDFKTFYPYVVNGGIIALHDVNQEWQGPYRAWNDYIKKLLKETGAVGSLAYGKKSS